MLPDTYSGSVSIRITYSLDGYTSFSGLMVLDISVSLLVPQKKGNELNLEIGQIVLRLIQWVAHTPGSVLFLPIIVMHMFSKARVVVTMMVLCNCVRFYKPDNSHFYEGFLDFNDTTKYLSLVHLYVISQIMGCGSKHWQIFQPCNILMLLEYLLNGEFLLPPWPPPVHRNPNCGSQHNLKDVDQTKSSTGARLALHLFRSQGSLLHATKSRIMFILVLWLLQFYSQVVDDP
jgi:hypothetical protein